MFERLVSVRLGRVMERSGVLSTTQFAYRKGLGTCDALLCVSHTLQSAWESEQEVRILQIDFSAAFDRVNHPGILYKLCSVGIGGSVLSILTQFLSNRSQQVSEWCDHWGMNLNASKTKTMIVSRSRTMHPQSPPINYWWNRTEGV